MDGTPATVQRRPVAMGCMRLSTAPDRDEQRAIAVLHAAFDAGVDFLDTADAYCRDENDIGHNERVIAHALRDWRGDTTAIRLATKGGLTRPGGRWVPDGRAGALAAACRASLRALGVERIPLYQLHAIDPRVPLSTSVRALASLKREGLIESIGLCNVTVGQLEEARTIAEIASVQVEVSLWRDDAVLGGMIEYCDRRTLVSHASLVFSITSRMTSSAGPRLARDPVRFGHVASTPPSRVCNCWSSFRGPVFRPRTASC